MRRPQSKSMNASRRSRWVQKVAAGRGKAPQILEISFLINTSNILQHSLTFYGTGLISIFSQVHIRCLSWCARFWWSQMCHVVPFTSQTSRQTTVGSQRGSSLLQPTASTCLSATSCAASGRTRSSSCPSMTPSNRPSSGATFTVLLSPLLCSWLSSPAVLVLILSLPLLERRWIRTIAYQK